MCDQTEVSYLENDVVWVKIGPIWWPGVVKDIEQEEEGKEILARLKKKPIAVVKFFQEDNYEFVKNLDQIYHYSCRRKDEFIKKGLDKFRTGAPHMKKFPADVTTAESLTNGDLNIINDPKFLPEKKESYSEIFGSGKKKSKKDSEVSPKGKARFFTGSTSYRPITHQRFINKVLHGESDHRVKTLIQLNSGSDDGASRNPYKCHICKFETSRVNVIVSHHRLSHSTKNAITWSGSDCKLVRRKPVYKSRKIKSKKFDTSRDDHLDKEASGKKKSPKGKFSKTKTKTNEKDNDDVLESTPSKRKSKEGTPVESCIKKPRFTDVLLADWDEDEDEDKKEDKTESENYTAAEDNESRNESKCETFASTGKTDNSEQAKNQNEKMSCFDFDEEEEGFIGMSNANTYGRKIPRVIPVKDKTELGMDLEIEELFKKKNESEAESYGKSEEDSESKINSNANLGLTDEKDQEEESAEKPVKGPGRRRRSRASKEEELKVSNTEDSLALRRTRRPGAKKSYLNEVIEKIEDSDVQSENEQKDEEKSEAEKKVAKIVKEETGSSSRRKQDFKQFTMDGDRDEIIYSNVINVERKPKASESEKKKKNLSKDTRRNNEDLTVQIDSLLEETKLPVMPELADNSVDQEEKLEEQKSANFSFDYLPGEQSEKKIAKTTKEVKSISRMFFDSIPNLENSPEQGIESLSPQSSQEEKSVHDDIQGKNVHLKHSAITPKRGSIVLSSTSKTSETAIGKMKVLPVMRQGAAGKDCIILPAGKKLKYVEDGEKSEEAETSSLPKNIKAIKVKSDSLPPSLITGGKLKGQTIIHQKGGKYVIVTQSPSLARQKSTPGKVQSGSKVVILTNQLGEQKIITTGGLQQTKFKVEGQKLVAASDSVTDKEDAASTSTGQSQQPMIKMVPDGKGGIMKQLTVSPKKLLLGGTKVLVSGSGSTFSTGSNVQKIALSTSGNVTRTGGDFRLIENYKGSGKMVLIPENACAGSGVVLKSATGLPRQITKVIQTPQTVQSVKKKPKILMRAATSQSEFVTQGADSPAFVVKQKGADGKFSTQKILRTEIVNQPKPTSSGTKTFFISGQGSNKKGESFIITTNESVAGKVIRMRQKVKEVDSPCSKATQKVQKAPEVYTISQNSLLVPSQTAIEGETPQIVQLQDQNQQSVLQTQVIAMPGPVGADGNQTYVLVSVDENGIVQGMDNSVVAYDTAAQSNSIFVNPTSSNNVILINSQSNEVVTPVYSTSSQDILAEALANTNVLEGTINNEMDSVVPSILLPPSIPSSVVQETSITLQKPIMTPLEMPSSVAPDTSGLEPPPLPPTPTEEDVLMEDSETAGVMIQEQQNEIENSSSNIQAYLQPETFDAGNSTKPLQVTDNPNLKVFEETKADEETEKKTPEYFQSELNLNINEQEDYKKLPQEEFILENHQEQGTNSFQSLPILSDEPDTSGAPVTEPIPAQQFDVEKSRIESEQFSKLLREQEPPSSTNNEILSENHGNGFEEFKYEKYPHMRESENAEELKGKEIEDKILEERVEAEKESTENRESMPVITDESNINAFEMDPMYSEVISQKRFQEETEVSSTTDEFSNKDIAN